MDTLSDNPWNVLVSWVKCFGQKSRLVVKINTFLRVPASVNVCSFVGREVGIYCAGVNNSLVGGFSGRIVALNTVDEVKCSVRVSNVMV